MKKQVVQTPHASLRYAPHRTRDGIALCLSGGGYRAALFHLGALRRLNELDILRQVKTITAVSGGSTIAAHLANTRDLWLAGPCPADHWEREISAPFREFTTINLSTPAAIKRLWHPFSNVAVEALAKRCEPLCRGTVQDLPAQPNFMFCATDLVNGDQWTFDRTSLRAWTVAEAVAISSCFPVFYRPFTESTLRIALVDGGVGDNRGVEPVWQTHEALLVSDGGDTLRPAWARSLLWSLMRSSQVMLNQMQLVQKRWLLANMMSHKMGGAYWGIGSSPRHYRPAGHYRARPSASRPYLGYSPALVRDVIAPIRTSYDAFSDAEAAVLENHGYLLADAAARSHLRHLPHVRAPLQIPHPGWLSDGKVRDALRDSSRFTFFGRGALRAVFGPAPQIVVRAPARPPAAAAPAPSLVPVTFARPDGTTGRGLLAAPAARTNGAGLILIHRSPALNHTAELGDRLVARGYTILVPISGERNGGTERPDFTHPLGDEFRDVDVQDILGAAQYLQALNASPGILGFGHQGSVALLWSMKAETAVLGGKRVYVIAAPETVELARVVPLSAAEAHARVLAFLDDRRP